MSRTRAGNRRVIDRAIAAHRPRKKWHLEAYLNLIANVRSKSKICDTRLTESWDGLVAKFHQIAMFRSCWLRDPLNWIPPEGSPFTQLVSLYKYLFVKYPVPDFVVHSAILDGEPSFRTFVSLAAGQSPRVAVNSLDGRFRMSKTMAREFMCAPKRLSIVEAVGWAQVLALGGDLELAKWLVIETDSWQMFYEHHAEATWMGFVRFLLRCQKSIAQTGSNDTCSLNKSDLSEIVEFVRGQCFRPAQITLGARTNSASPLQPDLSFDGRTLRSFRRHMRNWRTDLADRIRELTRLPANRGHFYRAPTPISQTWERSAVGSFSLDGDSGIRFSIDEILNAPELFAEGGIMQHCVASYHGMVSRRMTTIWSLKVHDGVTSRRLLTIQVDAEKKHIVQVKGKKNREPRNSEVRLLKKWSQQESLTWRDR